MKMDLIERYLQAIGRHLPGRQRHDILSELRSSLYDELEHSAGTGSDEERAIALIKKMGSPQEVAASYYPSKQYLIGPALYPFFKLVVGIVFTAVIGAQLLVVLISLFVSNETFVIQDAFWGILESLPFALGAVVAVFWALQRMDVQIDWNETFDPRALPPLQGESDRVSRGEQVFSILVNVIALVILARFAQQGVFAWKDGSGFFENPVITRYFPWIGLSMLIGIGLDILLLWQGHWRLSTRIAAILSNLLGLVLLWLMVQEHSAWLAAADLHGLAAGLAELPHFLQEDPQVAGMIAFRFGLAIAAVVVAVETVVLVYRLLRTRIRPATSFPYSVQAG
jgi:hypothetical protein